MTNLVKSLAAATLIAPLLLSPATAETHRFVLTIAGLTAGTISTAAKVENGQYAIKGLIRPSGIVAVFTDIKYDGHVVGSAKNGVFKPRRYTESIQTNDRKSAVQMSYSSNGTPKVQKYTGDKSGGVNPSSQKGALDLLTATYALFRDVPADQLCGKRLNMFDGKHSSRIDLNKAKISGSKATCSGAYRRVAGFSAKTLEQGSSFPFTLRYKQQSNGTYRLQDITAKSTVGTVRARRR